jgi:hypothetical protein
MAIWCGGRRLDAKGRVERGHGAHPDRLIENMRLKNIRTNEEARRYLDETHLA